MKFDIKNLHLHYGDFHALKGIDMQIHENKVTAFIGPSGCGKSTFLKTLNRMNDLVEGCKIDGTVLLDGKNVYGDIEVNELRRRVGMVFQKPNPCLLYTSKGTHIVARELYEDGIKPPKSSKDFWSSTMILNCLLYTSYKELSIINEK